MNTQFFNKIISKIAAASAVLALNLAASAGAAVLYVGSDGGGAIGAGQVGTYDSVTGSVINANFVTGLTFPGSIQVGNDSLYVLNFGNNTVQTFNKDTGAAQSSSLLSRALSTAYDIKLAGDKLYVLESGHNPLNLAQDQIQISQFNALTGVENGSFLIPGSQTGPSSAFSDGAYNIKLANGFVYVADSGPSNFVPFTGVGGIGQVKLYDINTGAYNSTLNIGGDPIDLEVDGSRLYALDYFTGLISVYNSLTGALIDSDLIGAPTPEAAYDILVSDGLLYVAQYGSGFIAFDALTGAPVFNTLVSGGPSSFAIPEPSRAVLLFAGLGLLGLRRRRVA